MRVTIAALALLTLAGCAAPRYYVVPPPGYAPPPPRRCVWVEDVYGPRRLCRPAWY